MKVTHLRAPNPSPLTLSGTNTYVVGSAWVVDPGPLIDSHLDAIVSAVDAPAGILLTHSHADHSEAAPELSARLGVPVAEGLRDGDSIGPFEADARFGFHHVNSYEDGDEVVVDICTFPDAGIVEDLYLERLRQGKPLAQPSLERFRISPAAGTVQTERLIDEYMELPRINYGRCNERPYRYAWGVGSDGGWIDRIVKADVVDRRGTTWIEDGCYPGEPVFVASPEADGEDDGVLLSVVLDGRSGNSFLLLLDAASLEEVARAEVPHHIPFGFHGQFSRG